MIRYSTAEWPWQSRVQNMLDGSDLETLHYGIPEFDAPFTRAMDQSTPWHHLFYERWPTVAEEFAAFVGAVIRPLYPGPIVYQKVPTFRVHMPGNVSVGEWHRDSDYAHDVHEENFWLPVTDAPVGRTVAVEFVQGSGVFNEVPVDYGQVLWFDGANLLHGCHVNHTLATRVSFDFRVVPEAEFVDQPTATTINAGMAMTIGGYFARME